jgi:NAD(P)-dependent dehydrogenase (short-subunit alcohol dehydrogenase family)
MNAPFAPLPTFRLDGRAALVTGASSGLGERFSVLLALAGAHVVLAARRRDRLDALAGRIAAAGGTASAVDLDVNDVGQIRAGVAEAAILAGQAIDILVNNSGISRQGPMLSVEPEDFDAVMATNTRGAFFVAQAVARRLIEAGRPGNIINIASAAGLRPLRQIGVYSISKAAVVHMTKSMAHEWARYGITVNAVCPGYIETEINRDYFPTEGGKKLISTLPRRRVGTPEDLDGLVLLLASSASHFINGAAIAADDGLTAA